MIRNRAYVKGLEWGVGYDSISNSPKSLIIGNFAETSGKSGPSGSQMNAKFARVESTEDLFKQLEIDASLSISFGPASLDARTSYATSQSIHEYSFFTIAHAKVVRAYEYIVNPQLKAEFADLKRNDPIEFRKQCGDQYVAGVTFGGELVVVVEIHCRDSDDKSKLTASLEGSYGAFGSFSGNLAEQFSRATNDRKVDFSIHQIGGEYAYGKDLEAANALANDGVPVSPESDLFGIMNRFIDNLNHKDLATSRAAVMEITLDSNDNLYVAGAPEPVQIQSALNKLEKLSQFRFEAQKEIANLTYAIQNAATEFNWETSDAVTLDAVRESLQEYENRLDLIESEYIKLCKDVNYKVKMSKLDPMLLPKLPLPSRFSYFEVPKPQLEAWADDYKELLEGLGLIVEITEELDENLPIGSTAVRQLLRDAGRKEGDIRKETITPAPGSSIKRGDTVKFTQVVAERLFVRKMPSLRVGLKNNP